MLDRGQELDWFQSTEVWIETGLFLMGLWMFGWHITSVKNPFTTPALFKDLNFVTALVMAFAVGAILLAGSALLPPMMQNLLGYPVSTAGLILAPRGRWHDDLDAVSGADRLADRRAAAGLLRSGADGMVLPYDDGLQSGHDVRADHLERCHSGHGTGHGLPAALYPLPMPPFKPELRTEASSLFNLLRNIGSSIGISISATELSWNVAINRTEMVNKLTEDHPGAGQRRRRGAFSPLHLSVAAQFRDQPAGPT